MLWNYPRELEGGVFLKRYKRFFADVEREGAVAALLELSDNAMSPNPVYLSKIWLDFGWTESNNSGIYCSKKAVVG
jgi:hypothetical protein